jgi:hypothetical protein
MRFISLVLCLAFMQACFHTASRGPRVTIVARDTVVVVKRMGSVVSFAVRTDITNNGPGDVTLEPCPVIVEHAVEGAWQTVFTEACTPVGTFGARLGAGDTIERDVAVLGFTDDSGHPHFAGGPSIAGTYRIRLPLSAGRPGATTGPLQGIYARSGTFRLREGQ